MTTEPALTPDYCRVNTHFSSFIKDQSGHMDIKKTCLQTKKKKKISLKKEKSDNDSTHECCLHLMFVYDACTRVLGISSIISYVRPQTSMASKGTSSYVRESVEVAHLNKQEKK